MKSYKFVCYLWDDKKAASCDAVGRLIYRSNLLGSDQRITNTGGGDTSAKGGIEGESKGHTTFAFQFPHGGSKAHNKIGQVAGLPEQTPHAKRRFPFLPTSIVTDCADL